jgi:serine/threonine-protein phosphatase 6 regulatory ankyrin repeat subunit A
VRAIHLAVKHGHSETVKVLVRHTDNSLQIRDREVFTALHIAAAYSRLDILSGLLDVRGNIDFRANFGLTPLHHAIRWKNLFNIYYLVSRNASLTEVDNLGHTVLHVAAHHGNSEGVSYLLEKGSLPETQNLYGKTPFQ